MHTVGMVYSRGCGERIMDTTQLRHCILLLIYRCTKQCSFSNAGIVSFYALSVQFSVLVSCHVIKNQEFDFTKGSKSGTESGQSFIGFQLEYYMLGTTTVSSRVVATLERMYVCLGLTVTEIKIKKVQKQENKNIRNVKRCRDGMQKSMQTRQGKRCRDEALYIYLHFYIISTLYTFWHAIPTFLKYF